jgi:hypothetical protein
MQRGRSPVTIELSPQLETAVNEEASARGMTPDSCVLDFLERNFQRTDKSAAKPLKNSYGLLAKYGPAPSAEEIDENRLDMLRGSIFAQDVE